MNGDTKRAVLAAVKAKSRERVKRDPERKVKPAPDRGGRALRSPRDW